MTYLLHTVEGWKLKPVAALVVTLLCFPCILGCGGSSEGAADTSERGQEQEVAGTVVDARGIPVDTASLTVEDSIIAGQTDTSGRFSVIVPYGVSKLSVWKDGQLLVELDVTGSAALEVLDMGVIRASGYIQPEVWPTVPRESSYVDLVNEAVKKYLDQGQNYVPYLHDFEAFGDFCNWSQAIHFRESEKLKFDASGIPTIKYGDDFYYNAVTVANFALHLHGRHLKGEEVFDRFIAAADHLHGMQDGRGAFPSGFRYKYYVTGEYYEPGWVSGMQQGQALSVFSRAYKLTGDSKYLAAGEAALNFMDVPISEGGAFSTLEDLHPSLVDYISFEEYPAKPATYTLNGFMFTLLGLYSWWQIDPANNGGSYDLARRYFDMGLATLEKTLQYYDIGGFSVYDLGYMNYDIPPHPVPSYHRVHIYLLHALHSVSGRKLLKDYQNKWSSYVN